MIKRILAAGIMTFAALTMSAGAEYNGNETAKLSYTRDGNSITVSVNGTLNNKGDGASDIIVAVYSDEQLLNTRILSFDENISNMGAGDFTITLPDDTDTVSVRAFYWSADGNCTPYENSYTVSDIPGNAYEVYGRVIANAKGYADGLLKDEVKFDVERSDLFNGEISISPENRNVLQNLSFKVGSTDIADHLFEYVHAWITHDDSSDDFTVVKYEPAAENEKVSFRAGDLADDAQGIGTSYIENRKLPVYTDADSSNTKTYELADDAILYVNGVRAWDTSDDMIKEYILNNPGGAVTLVDRTNTGSASNDGKYDYIMVDYYVNAVVSSVSRTASKNRISFISSDTAATKMEWDPSDKDVNITFYKNGKKISVDEINRYDSLAIKHDIIDEGTGSSSLTYKEYYEVYASSDTAAGKVESRDPDRNTAVISGTEYYFIPKMLTVTELSIGRTYTLFLNAFGNAVYSVSGAAVLPTSAPAEATAAPEKPFTFNGASSFVYIQSVNGSNTLNGTIRLNTSEQAKPLTADIVIYENGSEKTVKTIPLAAGSSSFSLNARALDHSGTPERAALRIMDGETELYRDDITITGAEELYTVKGRVTATSRNVELRKGEVKFDVELADEFDGVYNINPRNGNLQKSVTVGKGDTNAEDLLFIYSDAVIAKENGKYTFVRISPASDGQTVSFSCDDVADDDSTIGIDYTGNAKIPVYKSSTTTSTTKYDLAYDATMYVNGVELGVATNEDIIAYTGDNNPTGTVTLVDMTEVGSTANDGKYDYIMVDYYVDAVVDYTVSTSSKAKIYFKCQSMKANKMEWDTTDPEVDIRFIKDGKEINYTELAEYDVLSIQYDIVGEGTYSGSLTDGRYYNVLVSSNNVTDTITNRDVDNDTITIGGNTYGLNYRMASAYDFELGTKYNVYLDAFGQIIYYEEDASDRLYGVIVAMYRSSGNDYPTVRLVTSDGEIVAYECKDDSEAWKFYNYAISGDEEGSASVPTGSSIFTKYTLSENIKAGKTVCTYKLSGGKIMFDKAFSGNGGADLEFKASTSKLGTYSISDEVTKIIDMDEYMSETNNGTTVKKLSLASFEDEADYDAYLFDKNNDGVYRFAVVFKGISSIRPESHLAVVKKSNGQKYVDSIELNSYTVIRDGQEIELLVEEWADYLYEGDVVTYVLNSDGYAEYGDLYVLFSTGRRYDVSVSGRVGGGGGSGSGSSYDTLLYDTLSNDEFKNMINSSVVSDDVSPKAAYRGARAIAFDGRTSINKEVYAYFGVVNKKTDTALELFTKQSDGRSSVYDVADLAIDSKTNIYSFDYSKRANSGARLTYGSSPVQYPTIFDEAYVDDNTAVEWENVYNYDTRPQLALIKEVDGRVTDALFFIPPDFYEGYEPVDIEVNDTDYGVIVGMYKQPGKAQPTVYLITSDAEVTGYECIDSAEANRFYQYATGESGSFKAFDRSDIVDRIRNGETVCTYRLEDDRIILEQELSGNGGDQLEYKASSNTIGSYHISDKTKIVDIDAFINNDSANVRTLSADDFMDEAEYSAYLFDKSSSGIYRFAIVSGGTATVRPETQIAVVKKAEGEKNADTVTCSAYTVIKGGQETELLVEDSEAPLCEGDIVAYALNPDGYVDSGNIYVLLSMGANNSDYFTLLANTLVKDEFKYMINDAVVSDIVDEIGLRTKAFNNGARAIAYNGDPNESKEVYAYFGIVYRKNASNVELFTKQADGQSNVNTDVTDFTLSGADVYTYDFAERADEGVRLIVGNSGIQNTSIFNAAYVYGSDKNIVDFEAVQSEDIRPQLAFIKEVDGDVTDAVFFVAP